MQVSLRVGLFAHASLGAFLGLAGCDLPSGTHEVRDGRIDLVRAIDEAPVWSVRYGHEFWRREIGRRGEIDVGDAIERVTHAIDRPRLDALPQARTHTFTATFDGRGLRFAPRSATGEHELQLRTTRVALGGDEVYTGDTTTWSVLGNTAQTLLSADTQLVEHHEVRGDGVEVSW